MRNRLALVVSILALVLGAAPATGFAQTAPGSGDDVEQDQTTSTNSNEASQEANDEATTEQENSVEIEGSGDGYRNNTGDETQ